MATAAELTQRAAGLLNDLGAAYWTADELLGYLNEGLKLLVTRVPDQFSTIKTITLVAGVRQTLPAESALLLSVLRDVTNGGVPRFVDRDAQNAFDPAWREASPGPTESWMYVPRTPKVFWVSPPAVANAELEIETADYPADLLSADPVPVDPAYEGALIDYIVYRALSKDAEYAAADGRANVFYKHFLDKTGGAPGEAA